MDNFYKKNISIYYFAFFILLISGCNISKKEIKDSHIKFTNNQKDFELKKFNYQKDNSSQKSKTIYREKVKLYPTFEKREERNKKFIGKVLNNNNKSKNSFYLKLSGGYSNLKNYNVFDVSTNKPIWEDRYTDKGGSIELGLGRNLGKFRAEISYAREKGRFDEYLTYIDGSITRFDSSRGKLNKDFYFLNTYFDFWRDKKFSPFIGLGIGLLESSQESAPFIPSYYRRVFVKQFKVGISIRSSESNIIFLEHFKRDSNSHITSDGIGTPYTYEAKDGFDSEGIQIGLRKYF